MKKVKYFFFLFLLIHNVSLGQTQDNNINIQKRLQILETKDTLDETAIKDIQKDLKTLQGDFYKRNLWCIGLGAFVTLIITGIGYLLSINKFIMNKLKELFLREIHDNRNILLDIIFQREKESKFKDGKKIIVYSANDSDELFLKKLLVSNGFKKCKYFRYYPSEEHQNSHDVDVVICNNYSKQDKILPEVVEKINKLPDGVIGFYFGGMHLDKDVKDRTGNKIKKEITYANVPHQFYGNLMSALYYQDTL